MTSVLLQQWIQHPEALNWDTLYELRTLIARYPDFQSLRLLYFKNIYLLHLLERDSCELYGSITCQLRKKQRNKKQKKPMANELR